MATVMVTKNFVQIRTRYLPYKIWGVAVMPFDIIVTPKLPSTNCSYAISVRRTCRLCDKLVGFDCLVDLIICNKYLWLVAFF
jgi:hypothetical protein